MPRAARIALGEQVYHILTRGNNSQDVFKDDVDFTRYLEILRKYKGKYGFKLYHYALMRNHIHLVLETTDKGGRLSQIMKGINLSYAQHFKRRYRHIGHFWQDRYKSILISKDNYLLACGSYVELNPVRARVVEDPKDYRWSSYNVYAFDKKDTIVDEHPIYTNLSGDGTERRKKYREFVHGMMKEKNSMKGEMNRRMIYGGEDFITKMLAGFRIGAVIRQRGRPRKDDKEDK